MKSLQKILARLARAQSREEGMTLIEIMIVITILGMLAAVITVNVIERLNEARIGTTQDQIGQFKSALQLYNRDCGKYPTTSEGLNALVVKTSCPRWKPYLSDPVIPVDPWGNPYEYFSPGTHGHELEIISKGKDGELNTADDVVSWNTDAPAGAGQAGAGK